MASPTRSSSSTDDYKTDASLPTNALCGEGDATTTCRDSTRHYTITHDLTQKTAIIETAPTIVRPQAPPPTPDSPPKKRTRTKSPTTPDSKKCPTSYVSYDFSYPLHEYNLQGVTMIKLKGVDVMIDKGQRLQRPDETVNIDLPAFFMYQLNSIQMRS